MDILSSQVRAILTQMQRQKNETIETIYKLRGTQNARVCGRKAKTIKKSLTLCECPLYCSQCSSSFQLMAGLCFGGSLVVPDNLN